MLLTLSHTAWRLKRLCLFCKSQQHYLSQCSKITECSPDQSRPEEKYSLMVFTAPLLTLTKHTYPLKRLWPCYHHVSDCPLLRGTLESVLSSLRNTERVKVYEAEIQKLLDSGMTSGYHQNASRLNRYQKTPHINISLKTKKKKKKNKKKKSRRMNPTTFEPTKMEFCLNPIEGSIDDP
ncbi:hypothetical protein QQF64_010091 [Cirrhinus molitorella]|uniref:Uncharacterized protein n=1 Tax=Cirrhinus molitorella TaxID=172907 RepID=A0ABR3M6H2_9TELE